MATLLAVVGVLLLFAVVWIANGPPVQRIRVPFACDAVSPDGKYRCMGSMAHNGWCHNGDIEWRHDAWAISADDNTRAAGAAQVAAPITEQLPVRRRRLPWPLLLGGFFVVCAIANSAYDTRNPQQERTPHCDYVGMQCINWTTR